MSYSDDTAEFMFSGRPTMGELRIEQAIDRSGVGPDVARCPHCDRTKIETDDNGRRECLDCGFTDQIPARHRLCESCHRQEQTTQISFGDGTTFWVCDSCRPFDPRLVKVVNLKDTTDTDNQIPPSY